MIVSTNTDGGFPIRCEVCGNTSIVDVSRPPGDSVCPSCGTFLWVHAIAELMESNLLVADLTIPALEAFDKEQAILLLSNAIGNQLDWTESQTSQFSAAVLKREDLGSTGIGRGFAVPHANFDWIDVCFTAVAYLPRPIEFESLDGKPVNTIFMIAGPKSRPSDFLRMLELISRALRSVGPTA